MLIDSVIINLIRSGAGVGPDYSITIYGYGKVIYEGIENVKIKGVKESVIDDDSVVSILNEFKVSDFFSLKDNYSIDELENIPCTTISVSIPKNENEFIKKSIKYCQGDKGIPKELKKLEEKIEELVYSEQWVGKYESFIQKKDKTSEIEQIKFDKKDIPERVNKKSYKLVFSIIAILIVIFLITFSVYSGILDFSSNSKNDQSSVNLASNLEITLVEPAKSVDFVTGEYISEINFSVDDFVYIIQKYTNISTTNPDICDLYLDIIISNNNTLYHTDTENRTYIGKSIQVWYFKTSDLWPIGEYLVTVNLKDNISNTNATTKITTFYII